MSKQCPQTFNSPASVFHNPFGANFSTGFTGGFSELTGVSSELAGVSSELTGGFTVVDFLFSVLLSCEPVSAGSAVARVCPNTPKYEKKVLKTFEIISILFYIFYFIKKKHYFFKLVTPDIVCLIHKSWVYFVSF